MRAPDRAVTVTGALYGCLGLTLFLAVAAIACPLGLKPVERASPAVLDRHGALLRALPVEGGRWRLRANLDHIDPLFLRRLIALEDARFYLHPGVDPIAAVRAAAGDLAAGRLRSGASTLTMQLARRLDPRPRTFAAKASETLRAVQLDAALGKRRVLADYLTLAPYGGNIEGVRAASLIWFGHEPDHLSDSEQALLIALPQAPEARRPDRHPAAARAARARVLLRLQGAGLISQESRRLADVDPLPRRLTLPTLAWQAAGRLAREARPDQPEVRSTLDASLQARLEAIARQAATAQGPATSAAILVVDARTRAVRAAVGSAGLDRPGGWIDATRAVRSPGSVLKPFIYAMAFDAGIAAPETQVDDSPAAFGAYRPRNFDRSFRGSVTARQALQLSLNVPAVRLLNAVGPGVFEARLQAVDVELHRLNAGLAAPSLALALGGEGVRLSDVAMLYAALADSGLAKPLAWTEGEAAARLRAPGDRLVSADAARQVLDILRRSPPPTGRAPPIIGEAGSLAFKTGTSYGYRDAVAAGVGGGYVIVVWTGRPDGGSRPGETGRDAALPLLFDSFDLLQGAAGRSEPPEPLRRAPNALQQLAGAESPPPRLLFPPDGARLVVDDADASAPGLSLSAQGRAIRWYADGLPVRTDATTGQTLWRPPGPGFYRLTAIDDLGRTALARVRVETSGER